MSLRTKQLTQHPSATQRGVVLLLALIMLVAMTLAGIVLYRQIGSGLIIARNLSFKRTKAAGAMAVAITNDPGVPEVTLTEEEFRKVYKWTYQQFVDQLKKRYTDFKMNKKFSGIKKPLMPDPKFVRPRYLDPDNPKSGKKDFYSPAILAEFDKHYARKAT